MMPTLVAASNKRERDDLFGLESEDEFIQTTDTKSSRKKSKKARKNSTTTETDATDEVYRAELLPSPFFYYRDHSTEVDGDPLKPITSAGNIPYFPAKMHAILSAPDLKDIVDWDDHGRSFRIIRPKEFESHVLPRFFEHSKFTSYIRQANGWGFYRLLAGPNRGSYYHEYFLRSMPWLCKKMRRPKVGEKKEVSVDQEPDLNVISQEFPVPNNPTTREIEVVLETIKQGPKARMPVVHWAVDDVPAPPQAAIPAVPALPHPETHNDADQFLPLALGELTRRRSESGGRSDESNSDTTTGSKRKATGDNSKSSRSRKGKEDTKKKSDDPRWSKRFSWPEELHREFVAAVFEVGLKHSSPRSIMEHMKPSPDVMIERVKSHLQKYRLNHQKSRSEFMTSYDRALAGFKDNRHDFSDDGDNKFGCGEWAALLSHSVQTEAALMGCSVPKGGKRESPQAPAQNQNQSGSSMQDPSNMEGWSQSSNSSIMVSEHASTQTRGQLPSQDHYGVPTLHLPLLSVEESESPIGQQLGYLVGMFHTLCRDLEMRRLHQSTHCPLSYSLQNSAVAAPSQPNQVHAPLGGSYLVQRQDQQDPRRIVGRFSQSPYSHQGKQAIYLPRQDHGKPEVLHWNRPPIIHQPSVRHHTRPSVRRSPHGEKERAY